MASLTPLRVALQRAQRLQGMFVGDLAQEMRIQPNPKDKGWVGRMIEQAVAGTTDEYETREQDLSQAGVEIKAFGVGMQGHSWKAWEDLRITDINYRELVEHDWQDSWILKKVRATIMVPYWRAPAESVATCRCKPESPICRSPYCSCAVGCACTAWCPCRGKASGKDPHPERLFIMSSFVWLPSRHAFEALGEDYMRHAKIVRKGGDYPLRGLENKLGSLMRAAPHGGAKTPPVTYEALGKRFKAKRRGWMLRKEIVSQICRENMPGPWNESAELELGSLPRASRSLSEWME